MVYYSKTDLKEGLCMRISPIFAKTSYPNLATTGQNYMKNDCRRTGRCMDNSNKDVFVKLAEASMRDVKIESELKSMGLI